MHILSMLMVVLIYGRQSSVKSPICKLSLWRKHMVSCQFHTADVREVVLNCHGGHNFASITQQVPELSILHFDLKFDVTLELFFWPVFGL